MAEEIPLRLSEDVTIPGTHPIVIIGPNGSGKTRYGADFAVRNEAEFIGALRNIMLEENLQMRALVQANQELSNLLQRHKSNYWQMSNEINQLFSKLLVEDAASAIRFRDRHAGGEPPELEQTTLMRLQAAWVDFFPGRTIDFSTYTPTVNSRYSQPASTYSATHMSDGERVGLYLAARILNARSNVVVVDEPEVHFHSRLAVRFWNTLERARPDIRFVYITHDLTFALSRQSAQFVVIKPNSALEIVPLDDELPRSVAESILGAASFSIYASRIVFCEGQEGEAGDYSLYSSWFKENDTAVIPVGSCKDVVDCTQAFGNQPLITGLSAVGIIDRDYWPDHYLNSLPSSVWPLPVHELENLFCLRSVFEAVGSYLSLNATQSTERYSEFIRQAKERFTGGLLAKQLSERFKRRCQGGLDAVVNGLQLADDLDALQRQHVSELQPNNWGFDPESIFREERKRLESALSSDDQHDFLALFPGKVFLPTAARSLGINQTTYRELITSALRAGENDNLAGLGRTLEASLSEFLPPREIES